MKVLLLLLQECLTASEPTIIAADHDHGDYIRKQLQDVQVQRINFASYSQRSSKRMRKAVLDVENCTEDGLVIDKPPKTAILKLEGHREAELFRTHLPGMLNESYAETFRDGNCGYYSFIWATYQYLRDPNSELHWVFFNRRNYEGVLARYCKGLNADMHLRDAMIMMIGNPGFETMTLDENKNLVFCLKCVIATHIMKRPENYIDGIKERKPRTAGVYYINGIKKRRHTNTGSVKARVFRIADAYVRVMLSEKSVHKNPHWMGDTEILVLCKAFDVVWNILLHLEKKKGQCMGSSLLKFTSMSGSSRCSATIYAICYGMGHYDPIVAARRPKLDFREDIDVEN